MVASPALPQEDSADERLRRLERALAEERARNAANEAALRILQGRLDIGRPGAERGGAEGAVDDDRVRKIVREMLGHKKTTDELRKSMGVLEAGFKKPVDYQGAGFFIKSGDEFQLNINARLQLRYIYGAFNPRRSRG